MPSTARTAYLPIPQPSYINIPGVPSGEVELTWPAKDPADTLDYTFDCTAWLNDAGGDTINAATVTLTITPGDVTVASSSFTPTALTWFLTGGSLSNPIQFYQCRIGAQTVGGLQIGRTIYMPVMTLSPLQTGSGFVQTNVTAAELATVLASLGTVPAYGLWLSGGGGNYTLAYSVAP